MNVDSTIEIGASTSLVWEVFSDVERWPEWTTSVTHLVGLDGPVIAVGKRFEIKQPRLPRLVWEVTEVVPGASWTWVQRSAGGLTFARHEVIPKSGGGTLVRQEIDQRGLVGSLLGWFMLRMTKRYLELEARGLRARDEQLQHLIGPPT
jgi:uncharacterized protein YndB with AHSA1/START domain